MNYVIRHGRRIAIETELLDAGQRPQRQQKPFKADFVKVPMSWVEALRQTEKCVYELALALLVERHVRNYKGGDVVISAKTVPGMPPTTRRRATKRLVRLNLIEVDKGSRRIAPRVLSFRGDT
jgi:hypothetical protein